MGRALVRWRPQHKQCSTPGVMTMCKKPKLAWCSGTGPLHHAHEVNKIIITKAPECKQYATAGGRIGSARQL